MAALFAILKIQEENLNSGRYDSIAFSALMKVSCDRSSASSRSRTMRNSSAKIGRS